MRINTDNILFECNKNVIVNRSPFVSSFVGMFHGFIRGTGRCLGLVGITDLVSIRGFMLKW